MFRDLIETSWRGGLLGYGEARVEDAHAFWPGEAPAIARATPARQAEFAAGRAAARAAMRAVGMVPYAIPMGSDRAPVWPVGVVGSISHSTGLCIAVAARARALSGLGIDIEPLDPLPEELWPDVLTPADRDWLMTQDAGLRGGYARMIFSAKEATYKALYPRARRIVGFDAMDILPDLGAGRFLARLNTGFGPIGAGMRLTGQLFCASGLVCTLLALPRGAECGANVAGNSIPETECFSEFPA